MNDGVCDPTGRFWAGSMAYDATPGAGSLYRVDHDLTVTQVLADVTIPNGPAFSPQGDVLYLADSARGTLTAYDLDLSTGRLGAARTLLQTSAGEHPDGMTTDDDGNLWVAIWGGGRVVHLSPGGTLLGDVAVGTPQPTAPCLVSADGMVRLVITTAAHGLCDKAGTAGSLWSLPVAVGAARASQFKKHRRNSAKT